MFFTIDSLLQQDRDIIKWYKNGKILWDQLLAKWDMSKQININHLANDLWRHQFDFESKCGGKSVGQEIMAIIGIVQFYNINTGFEPEWNRPNDYRLRKALNVYRAFQSSTCSTEVKFAAKRIAKLYGLEENYL